MGKIKKTVVAGDIHIPAHCPKAVSTFMNFLKDFKPDELILNGDIVDNKDISTHADADPAGRVKVEFDMTNRFLDDIRKIVGPKCKIVFAAGNHLRLDKFIKRNAPQLEGMLSVEEILRLKQRKIEFIPYKSDVGYWINSKLFVHHGFYHGEQFAAATLKKLGNSCIVSHTHRMQTFTASTIGKEGPQVRACWGIGCLIPLENIPYMTQPSSWIQGWGVVFTDTETDHFAVHQYNLVNHKLLAPNGKIYKPSKNGWTGK